MENKVIKFEPKDGLNANYRRRSGFTRAYLVITEKLEIVLECRIYWTASRCYACLWIRGECAACGGGFAGDCGYDRESAAIATAIQAAGVTLEKDIDGVGREAVEGAFRAIADRLVPKGIKFEVFSTYE